MILHRKNEILIYAFREIWKFIDGFAGKDCLNSGKNVKDMLEGFKEFME